MHSVFSKIINFTRHYPTTIVGFFIISFFLATNFTYHIDLFKVVINFLNERQFLDTEEIIFSVILIIITMLIDQFRNVRRTRRKRSLEQDRLNVARATMSTMNDLVGNFLNNILLIKIDMEKNEPLSSETITMFNDIILKLTSDMRRINDIDVIAERNLSESFQILDLKD